METDGFSLSDHQPYASKTNSTQQQNTKFGVKMHSNPTPNYEYIY